MPELFQALYHSRSLVPDNTVIHNEILSVSQRNNAAAKISGFLHREGDFFIQYLEGPKTSLYDTLSRIGRDSRHEQFEVVQSCPLERRMLPDWKMGFADAAVLSLSELLDTSAGHLEIRSLDPFDLVVFMVHNSQLLREEAALA